MFFLKTNLSLSIFLFLITFLHLGCERNIENKQTRDSSANLAQVNDEFINTRDLESNFSIIWIKIGNKLEKN